MRVNHDRITEYFAPDGSFIKVVENESRDNPLLHAAFHIGVDAEENVLFDSGRDWVLTGDACDRYRASVCGIDLRGAGPNGVALVGWGSLPPRCVQRIDDPWSHAVAKSYSCGTRERQRARSRSRASKVDLTSTSTS